MADKKLNNNIKIFLQSPPDVPMSFSDVVQELIDGGYGNERLNEHLGQPWNEDSWERWALKRNCSLKFVTVERWAKGKAKRIQNNSLQEFCRMIAAERGALGHEWRLYLRQCLKNSKDENTDKGNSYSGLEDPTPARLGVVVGARERDQGVLGYLRRLIRRVRGLSHSSSGTLPAFELQTLPSRNELSRIENIRMCATDRFAPGLKTCYEHTPVFPFGTQVVFVSFLALDVPNGTPFKRSWYRNGEKFLEKVDVFDDAWPGHTYIQNENGHDPGQYVLRITLNHRVFTQSFIIEARQ